MVDSVLIDVGGQNADEMSEVCEMIIISGSSPSLWLLSQNLDCFSLVELMVQMIFHSCFLHNYPHVLMQMSNIFA